MAEDATVQALLDLSAEWLRAAEGSHREGNVAPSRFLLAHALELGMKAALAKRLGHVPRTHNVGGLFGREFVADIGQETARRLNRIVGDYDGPRYPDWTPPDPKELEEDLALAVLFIRETLPRLLERS